MYPRLVHRDGGGAACVSLCPTCDASIAATGMPGPFAVRNGVDLGDLAGLGLPSLSLAETMCVSGQRMLMTTLVLPARAQGRYATTTGHAITFPADAPAVVGPALTNLPDLDAVRDGLSVVLMGRARLRRAGASIH